MSSAVGDAASEAKDALLALAARKTIIEHTISYPIPRGCPHGIILCVLLLVLQGNPYAALAGDCDDTTVNDLAVAKRITALKKARTDKQMADVLQDGVLLCAAVGAPFDAGADAGAASGGGGGGSGAPATPATPAQKYAQIQHNHAAFRARALQEGLEPSQVCSPYHMLRKEPKPLIDCILQVAKKVGTPARKSAADTSADDGAADADADIDAGFPRTVQWGTGSPVAAEGEEGDGEGAAENGADGGADDGDDDEPAALRDAAPALPLTVMGSPFTTCANMAKAMRPSLMVKSLSVAPAAAAGAGATPAAGAAAAADTFSDEESDNDTVEQDADGLPAELQGFGGGGGDDGENGDGNGGRRLSVNTMGRNLAALKGVATMHESMAGRYKSKFESEQAKNHRLEAEYAKPVPRRHNFYHPRNT